MRGLIDRITNRDKIEEMGQLIEEKDLLLKRQGESIEELGEMADRLTGTIRVLKMRIDTVMPAGQPGIRPDE